MFKYGSWFGLAVVLHWLGVAPWISLTALVSGCVLQAVVGMLQQRDHAAAVRERLRE